MTSIRTMLPMLAERRWSGRRAVDSPREEVADHRRDLRGVGLEREVARVEEVDRRAGNVASERLGAARQKEGVVLSPHRQEGRLARPEVALKGRVERDVALVITEEVQLDLVSAAAAQIEVIERIAVRRNGSDVGHTVRVLPARRLGSEEAAERLSVGRRRLLPISPYGVPAVAQPLLIGVTVLRDDRGEAVRMSSGQAEADGCAIVEDVHREAIKVEQLGEAIDDVRDALERVGEGAARRHVGLPKPR